MPRAPQVRSPSTQSLASQWSVRAGKMGIGPFWAKEQCPRLDTAWVGGGDLRWGTRVLLAPSAISNWPSQGCHLNPSYASWASADAPRSLRLTYLLESRGGKLALVLCTVDSRPPAQLALHHAGRLLASSVVTSVPNTLRLELREPRPNDEGLYSCSAQNPLGQANTSLELRLEGELGPVQGHRGGSQLWCLTGPS